LDGKGGLHFSTQLLIKPFERRLEGLIKGRIHQNEVELGYQVNNDFVVVYTAT
jgi:hypothetical protein